MDTTTKPPGATRERREWGRNGSSDNPSAFSGLENRGKRGDRRGGPARGRGGGRGAGRGARGGARTRGASISSTTTATAPTLASDTSNKAPIPISKSFSKASDGTSKSGPAAGKPRVSRRSSAAKTIPQIIVPPPSTTATLTTSNKVDEINALVEHVRAGVLTPNAPITPFTPSHIDWAGDDDDDGSLPDLDDWGVTTSNTGNPVTGAPATGLATSTKSETISPILVEGLKSLPEPNVPAHLEPEHDPKLTSVAPPEPLPAKAPGSPSDIFVPEVSGPVSTSTSGSSSLHPSLPPKPVVSGSTSRSNAKAKSGPGAGKDNIRGGSTPRAPRDRAPRTNTNKNGTQPSSTPSKSNPTPDNAPTSKNPHPPATKDKPVSGGVALSTPSAAAAGATTPPESYQELKGLTESIHAPKEISDSTDSKSTPTPLASKARGGPGSYVPPRSTFVPTPAPLPSSDGGLAAEFTFPSLSPSPISGHYPTGPRGPGGAPNGGPETSNDVKGGAGGSSWRNNTFGNGFGNGNGNGGRNGYNNRNYNHPPRYNQAPYRPSQFPPKSSNDNNSVLESQPNHPPYPFTSSTHTPSPYHTPRHTPNHTPHHSREHSVTRPIITGDAISKLARTIAGSPAKA